MKQLSAIVPSSAYWALLALSSAALILVFVASLELGYHFTSSIQALVTEIDDLINGTGARATVSLPSKLTEIVSSLGAYVERQEFASAVGIWWVQGSVAVAFAAVAVLLSSRDRRVVRAGIMGLLAMSTALSVFGTAIVHALRFRTEGLQLAVGVAEGVVGLINPEFGKSLGPLYAQMDSGFVTFERNILVLLWGFGGLTLLQMVWMVLIGVADRREDITPECDVPCGMGYLPIKGIGRRTTELEGGE